MKRRGITGAAAVAVALCACGGREVAVPAWEVTDSVGIAVAQSHHPAWSDGEAWTVGPPQLVVGGDDVELFDVAGAVRLPAGGLVIADGGTSRLLFFDADGTLVAEAGGEGDGPGEFRIIQSLGTGPGDEVWVYDYGHRRFSFFDVEGGYRGSAGLTPALSASAVLGRWVDGSFLVSQLWGDGGDGPLSPGLTRDPVVYARYAADGSFLDTLTTRPGREVLLRPEGQRMTMGVAPFARGASHSLASHGFVVGDQIEHELSVLDSHGALRRVIRWAGGDLALEAGEVEDWKASQVASADAADRNSVRAYLRDVPVPDRRPAYGRLLVDTADDLWVASYAHPSDVPSRWDVFAPSGRWLGAVEMPEGFQPLQVGSAWILGSSRDDFDVERIEIRSLVRQ